MNCTQIITNINENNNPLLTVAVLDSGQWDSKSKVDFKLAKYC
jgi:hypothetical protein